MRLLFIDADSNGRYFEDDDLLMYNSWNPYARDSVYQEVPNYMDNFWYHLGFLKRENFTTFVASADFRTLEVKNANSDFVGSKDKGKIVIRGLESDMRVTINGKRYDGIKKGVFESEIQYGYFNLRIGKTGRLDFRKNFSVGLKESEVVIDYEATGAAGGFTLTNHNFRNWKLVFDDGQAPATFYNESDVSLPAGNYKVIVSDGTNNFSLSLQIQAGEHWEYNFADDKLRREPPAAAEEEEE